MSPTRAGLSNEDIEHILLPYIVPLIRFLQERGLLALFAEHTPREAIASDPPGPATPPVTDDLTTMSAAADDLSAFLDM